MDNSATHFYEPRNGHGLQHDPMPAIIAPRPIGWISSMSATGLINLAPYSFFNQFNYGPPIIGFASVGWKDSVANIAATREFVWNLATRPLAVAMNISSASVSAEIDEFELAGLEKAPCHLVAPPRVMASPASFECRLSQLIRLTDSAGTEIDTWMILGEVVGVHIAREALKNGIYQTVVADPILRAGGMGDYFTIAAEHRFMMERPGADGHRK